MCPPWKRKRVAGAGKAAEDVVALLANLSREGRTVLCTVHQPSWKLVGLLDDIVLLAGGQLLYDGAAQDLPSVLADLGAPVAPTSATLR